MRDHTQRARIRPSDIIIRAKEYWERHGWAKETYIGNYYGEACLLGGMKAAQRELREEGAGFFETNLARIKAKRLIYKQIRETGWNFYGRVLEEAKNKIEWWEWLLVPIGGVFLIGTLLIGRKAITISTFNDDPSTNKEDIDAITCGALDEALEKES